VHLRRATILFALVLGLTALAAAVSPSRDSGEAPSGSAAAPPAVGAAEGGLVTIPRLGRTATVAPAAPAMFDLLAPAPGRYDLLFAASSLDEPRRVGTVVVRP